jgi:hypothetical protein
MSLVSMFRIAGAIVVIVTLGVFGSKLELFKVFKYGEIVTMKIIDLDCNIGTKINDYGKFEYKNKQYIKQIGYNFCTEHEVGDDVLMKYSKSIDEILYPKEKMWDDFLSVAIMFLFGMYLIFYNLLKFKS